MRYAILTDPQDQVFFSQVNQKNLQMIQLLQKHGNVRPTCQVILVSTRVFMSFAAGFFPFGITEITPQFLFLGKASHYQTCRRWKESPRRVGVMSLFVGKLDYDRPS
jgi:hypothetical protein